jgi:hypothetical protein
MSQTFKQRAQVIQNETLANANTASRVGGLLADMCNQFDTAYINYFDFSSDSVTSVAVIDTWYKLNSDTTEGFSRDGLVHSNNRVTYTGSTARIFQCSGIASITGATNNELHLAFFKNDTLIPCSEQQVTAPTGGRVTNIPFQCLVELGLNDYIEVWTKNASSDQNITLQNLNVIIDQK